MKYILEVDGGGIRGVIPSEVCAAIENYLHKPLNKVFDLISGTSTGAILGSMIAAGVPADICRDLYVKRGPEAFKPRPWYNPINIFKEKYDRANVLKIMAEYLSSSSQLKKSNPLMHELPTKFVCTSTSIVDEQTHYFKSWESKDGSMSVLDAVARSFAAAYYFGAINDPPNKQVWADGGEGLDNCTVRQCIIESMMQDWVRDGVYILSLGCGYVKPGRPYEEAKKMGWVKESAFYVNLARRQSAIDQIFEAKQIEKLVGNKIEIDRLDVEIPTKMDKLDAIEYIKDFQNIVLKSLPVRIAEVSEKLKRAVI